MTGRVSVVENLAGVPSPLLAVVAAEGSRRHSYTSSDALLRSPHAARNFADAVHQLCELHGRHPGIIDHAADRLDGHARDKFVDLAKAFGAERALLARLVVAVGPLPSTPGQPQTESAIRAQQHALETLGRSDRAGCGAGAAIALALDWHGVRPVLEAAARRFGIETSPTELPEAAAVTTLMQSLALSTPAERALTFGAQQMIAQHRALWDLLEARALARADD